MKRKAQTRHSITLKRFAQDQAGCSLTWLTRFKLNLIGSVDRIYPVKTPWKPSVEVLIVSQMKNAICMGDDDLQTSKISTSNRTASGEKGKQGNE